MWAVFTSALSWAFGWVFRLSIVKFVVFGAIALVLTPLMTIIMGLVDATGLADIQGLFDALPTSILFFLVVFKLDVGIPMLIAAMLVKFFIRRLPVVG